MFLRRYFLAVVLILLVALVVLIVLVLLVVLVLLIGLILALLVLLILVLIVHDLFLQYIMAVNFRYSSLCLNSGFILCFENNSSSKSCNYGRGNSTG